jgi:hypothetical protein
MPLLFNFASEYAISKVQENQVELKLNGTHSGSGLCWWFESTGNDARREVVVEVNIKKTKYMLLPYY